MKRIRTVRCPFGIASRIVLGFGALIAIISVNGSYAGAQTRTATTTTSQSGTLLFTGITLTPEQRAAVNAIHAQSVATIKQRLDAVKQTNGTKKALNPDFSALRDSAWAEMRLVLTPEQQTTFDHNVVDVRKRSERKPAAPPSTRAQ